MTETATAGTEFPFAPLPPEEAVEHLKRLMADRPMTKLTMPYGGDVWIVHRNRAARTILADRRFVRESFRTGERVVPFYVPFPDFLRTTLQFEDPPQHTKLRRLVQKAISPRRVRDMRASAAAFAGELIDGMLARGGVRNLVAEYSVPLPVEMLSSLLGVPSADREKFERWSSSTMAVAGRTEQEIAEDMSELAAYMTDLIAQRRAEPRDDLLSSLAHARDKDETLTDAEILPIAFILIVGGFDNTANFLTTGVMSLLHSDEQRELFLADPDGLAPTAAEEVLRHGAFAVGGPVGGGGGLVPFVATEDVVVDGQLIAKGEAVSIDPGAANHDPAVVTDPDRFDITRKDNPHLMLSHGLHHCLGAPLARMEMQVGMAEIFKRIPTLRQAGDPVIRRDVLTQPMTDLPVTW
ncbi:cytochrome P450 [Streptomyces turgidiscabies]|uniref:Unspecific monooxygenase n=1 Tax=Streptomyces turgidiscabies (strain Car8) TaxID=698760 RepID=L7FEN3_STRT8|nr:MULTISPECIES: cytochrome P450 [Streptomyces]ELP69551.1 unspecific monooxygenase [Streptomyces turgidiscabies Car8]MDX3496135.1 cytochrome P450 [Streptomyces turgidiscabies]GAQ75368.1 cytochrome P450 107B1 [Streptomyces turgidiscabies]